MELQRLISFIYVSVILLGITDIKVWIDLNPSGRFLPYRGLGGTFPCFLCQPKKPFLQVQSYYFKTVYKLMHFADFIQPAF